MRAMRKLLAGMDDVDDILIHSRDWDRLLTTIREVLRRLSRANLKARPTKCLIGTSVVEFLGHEIRDGLTRPVGGTVEKINQDPMPKTKREIRSFLGLTGFYRDYIPDYAAIAVPLSDLTKKGLPNKVTWSEAQEKAYKTLKSAITDRPILHLPDHSKLFILRTDASDVGIGAILLRNMRTVYSRWHKQARS